MCGQDINSKVQRITTKHILFHYIKTYIISVTEKLYFGKQYVELTQGQPGTLPCVSRDSQGRYLV